MAEPATRLGTSRDQVRAPIAEGASTPDGRFVAVEHVNLEGAEEIWRDKAPR